MSGISLLDERLTGSIIKAFYEVYNTLGYGFLEAVYVMALERELRARGHEVLREVRVRVTYKGQDLTVQRIDMLVDRRVLVEIKSTHELPGITRRQVLNYLKATNLEVALLLHFGPNPRFYRLISSNSRIDPRASAAPASGP